MDIADLLANEERTAVEQWVRRQSKVVPAAGNRVLARVLGSFLLYLDMRDESIAPHLAIDGYWEMWATIAVARYVKLGMRCIDIGASFGYYTLLLTELVGEQGWVQAWEPLLEARACLRSSVSVNGRTNVEVLDKAASDEPREAVHFLPPPGRWGDAALDCSHVYEGSGRAGAPCVDCLPIDMAEPEPPVDFIKVDAEGHEAQIWDGMQRTLARSPNVQLMVEFTPEDHAEPGAFLDQIDQDGFGVRLVADNGELTLTNRADLCQPGVKLLWLSRR